MTANPKPVPFTDQEHAYFAGRLRRWRIERGMLLKQVAAEFGVAEATWSRWERQERFPSPTSLRLLAEFIGVPICCFFYPDESSCPNCSRIQKKPNEPIPSPATYRSVKTRSLRAHRNRNQNALQ